MRLAILGTGNVATRTGRGGLSETGQEVTCGSGIRPPGADLIRCQSPRWRELSKGTTS